MSAFSKIRKNRISKFLAAFLAVNLLAEVLTPTFSMALTGGPTQQEFQSFEPAGTSDMVDLFTGDFNYNIPLFDLPGPNGGYPFNLSYHSGIGMDQEASWVGLGWNINPGAINRDKRGIPDDFNGNKVTSEYDMAENTTWGVVTGGDVEIFGGSMGFGIGGDLSIYNNSFKGIGYSLSSNTNFSSETASLGLGLSIDSQEGVGANASISFGENLNGSKKQARKNYAGLGLGFNSQSGLTASAFGHVPGHSASVGGSHSYTFSDNTYTPSFSPAMTGYNLQVKTKLGVSAAGTMYSFALGGYYRTEKIKEKKKEYKAYGYNYLENAGNEGMMDFNREKDGMVSEETPNLPNPILTYDTYTAYGQGFAGSYRAHRNDVGHLHDPYTESRIRGGSSGVDIGIGFNFQLGLEGSGNTTVTSAGDWQNDNQLVDLNGAQTYNYRDDSKVADPSFEKLYYKMKGELSAYNPDELNFIGGELAVRANLVKEEDHYNLEADKLKSTGEVFHNLKNQRENNLKRIPRNSSIQPITNEELLQNTGSEELLNEYKIKYRSDAELLNYHFTQNELAYNRSGQDKAHNAGFSCLNSDGMRYVYALPAYNTTEEELVYTYNGEALTETTTHVVDSKGSNDYLINNTEKFFNHTTTDKYAHAYLLTSVLGADYVDVGNDGITDDDLGYWVKFNYVKTADNFKWRAPYYGAMYLRGKNNSLADDKAMFNYGEKEMWYLASAETKSHIAVFKISSRNDGGSAVGRYTGDAGTVQPSYKLDEIYLFSKANYNDSGSAQIPLKTVHFDYTYDLCPNVPNNTGAASGTNINKGKLTLKKVWFTYQKNTRGVLSPYTFDYNELESDGDPLTVDPVDSNNNPSFQVSDYINRWGGYRRNDDFFKTKGLSYVTQFNPGNAQTATEKQQFKASMDQQAAVWNLKKIGLPTGGNISVTYESDDYGYVQHRRATQMFQIEHLGDASNPNKIYSQIGNDPANERKVYFKLETPISSSNPTAARNKFLNDYINPLRETDGTYPMYFRIHTDLRDNTYEYVTGYVDLDVASCGLTAVDGNGNYTQGYVTLKTISGQYHPFAVAAWQYLRINMPQLLTAFTFHNKLEEAPPGSSDKDKAVKVASLGSVIPTALQLFTGYKQYAFNRDWGQTLHTEKSFIRLAVPDRVKLGGGLRVKAITYSDNWNQAGTNEKSNDYGQVYDYTITEGEDSDAVTYSSGVAQYEPMIGGDEIALRHPKNYQQNLHFKTDNNLFFEYPINEGLYPGPNVGYRKVTVQSLAAKTAPSTANTTGRIEYEFYTAKEFPVITNETDNMIRTRNKFIPIPFIGQITANKLFASQGYAITLNDMHGKMKKVTNFAKNVNGEKTDVVTSSVSYHYKSEIRQYDGQEVSVLINKVPAIVNESLNTTNHTMETNKKDVIVGEEYDFFTDSRSSQVYSTQFGGAANVLLYPPYAGIPVPWPTVSESTRELKMFVTNKIISKTGILDQIIATDGQSTVETKNLLFDSKTGIPLLTVVSNDFNNPIYNYKHPANWEYDGMGAAATNAGFKYCAKIKSVNATTKTFTIQNEYKASISTGLATAITKLKDNGDPNLCFPIDRDTFQELICPGDEVIIQKVSGGNKFKATLISNDKQSPCISGSTNTIRFHCDAPGLSLSAGNELYFTIVRSGRRNQLNTEAGTITALKDPTDNANRGSVARPSHKNCMMEELAVLLNELLLLDDDPAPGAQLPLIAYPISQDKYPVLGSIYSKITISKVDCNIIGLVGDPYYSLQFSYVNEFGVCNTISCSCQIPYKTFDTVNEFSSFEVYSASGCSIRYVYNYGQNITDFSCVTEITGLQPYYSFTKDVINSSSTTFRDFSNYDGGAYNSETNLYASGKAGIWKPFVNYLYWDNRANNQLTSSTGPDVKLSKDGVFRGNNTNPLENEFYLFSWKSTLKYPIPENWKLSSIATQYDANSNPVETHDRVNVYSGSIFGYNGQLPVIQAKNAKKSELFFESFETSSSLYTTTGSVAVYDGFAHSGSKCLEVAADGIKILSFKPNARKYTVSMWISKNTQPITYANTAEDIGIKLVYYNADNSVLSTSALIRPSGNVIEKWQRIEGEFTPPDGTEKIGIKFKVTSSGTAQSGVSAYFDDIRVFPFNATLKTSVYNPVNFRLMSELDDNNFATFYYYDEEGKLFLVKKETATGIKTIIETRTHIKE